MRAKEFLPNSNGITISIPINITIPAGGGMPVVGTVAAPADDDLPENPVMVPPLQQNIELAKQQGGRQSKIINQLINGGKEHSFPNSPKAYNPTDSTD